MFGIKDMHPDEGRWPTKEELRKRFRRPANETINELGEGRGYEERRKQRLKDNHGVEAPDPFWKTRAPAEPMNHY
ncbi:hypothetical protein LTR05_002261 [Lithohypha guttulata]|uniref:Uncharacterized protein n=1 Tax=Lithohypha guttulata TaxID=1690604 RepID=A0AAN7Y7X7_9EURO|nr:hypothetical protein LTR05_002261 [Lithohypha guttulata]